jgi:hypothetical protein
MTSDFNIFKGQSHQEYLRVKAVSNSQLGILATRSPAHLKHQMEHGNHTQTQSQVFGSALHSRLLTPELYVRDYARRPAKGYAKTHSKADQDAYALWLKRHGDKAPVPHDDFDAIEAMAKSVQNNQKFVNLLKPIPTHWREVSLYWKDDIGGPCKARLDAYNEELDCILDLKTTRSAHPSQFAKAIRGYGYYRQAAFYMRAARACGLQPKHFVFIALEKEPPFAMGLYRITDASIAMADRELRELLNQYSVSKSTDKWPDYGTEVQDIEVPGASFLMEENDNG